MHEGGKECVVRFAWLFWLVLFLSLFLFIGSVVLYLYLYHS
jgi:hypothetical protein